MELTYKPCEDFVDTFVAVDIETTGLKYERNKIIQLSAVKYKNGKEIDRFDEYINPEEYIPRYITGINGITNEMVKNKPKLHEVLPSFVDFLEDYTIVAHNSSFDMKFIIHNLNIYNRLNGKNLCIKNNVVDTLLLSRKHLKGKVENNKLITLKSYFGVKTEKEHCGIDDAYSCAEIYLKIRGFI